jgi:hypothetical protein
MNSYESERQKYKPEHINFLLIAESPPPEKSVASGSRNFYRADMKRPDDRLFNNTIWAIYPETEGLSAAELQEKKLEWLKRFKRDGFYMIEALEESQEHKVTKKERQDKIRTALPKLIARVTDLVDSGTRIILIKSNVFEVAAKPLEEAGFKVLNQENVDYPGHFNQKAYRQKLHKLVSGNL